MSSCCNTDTASERLYTMIRIADTQPENKDLSLNTVPVSNGDYFYSNFSHARRVDMTIPNTTSEEIYRCHHDYKNEFLNTIMMAYNLHLSLRLSPDDILLAIDNIISRYINEDPEKFRFLFVEHSSEHKDENKNNLPVKTSVGKKILFVDMDELAARQENKNTTQSIWDLTVMEWTKLIGKEVKNSKFIQAASCDFTTSSGVDFVSSQAFVMDMVKQYFQFVCLTRCGIPYVDLTGTVADWTSLITKLDTFIELFREFTLSEYLQNMLRPILQMFLVTKQSGGQSGGQSSNQSSTEGKAVIPRELIRDYPDIQTFWGKIINHNVRNGSGGGTFWSGWIIKFFPSIKKYQPNVFTIKASSGNAKKQPVTINVDTRLDNVTNGLTNVPVIFIRNGTKINLSIVAGFHGIHQDNHGVLQTIRGYYLTKSDHTQFQAKSDDEDVDEDCESEEDVEDEVDNDVIVGRSNTRNVTQPRRPRTPKGIDSDMKLCPWYQSM